MYMKLNSIIIAVAMLAAFACSDGIFGSDDDDPEEQDSHNLSFSISGDFEEEKTGVMGFWGAGESSFDNESEHHWQMLSEDSDPGPQTFRLDFVFLYQDEAVWRPDVGDYGIGDNSVMEGPEEPVFSATYIDTQRSTAYSSLFIQICGDVDEYEHSGVLSILSSTDELVTGSFEFEAYSCEGGNIGETIVITGEFEAPRLDLM